MSCNEPVRVEQCDRDFASDLLDQAGKSRPAALIRGGGLSDHPLLQRLARHRTLSQADGRGEVYEAVRKAAQAMIDNTYVGKPGSTALRSRYGHQEARYYHALRNALKALTEVHQEKSDG